MSVCLSVCQSPRLQDRIDAAGLPRTVRFLACVAGVATLWMASSFTQSAIGFFVACTYWRTLLAPREVGNRAADTLLIWWQHFSLVLSWHWQRWSLCMLCPPRSSG